MAEKKAQDNAPAFGDKKPSQTRWVKNAFFEGGVTKYPRLDELTNYFNDNVNNTYDTTDAGLAAEILERANLREHPKYDEIHQGLTDFFEMIPDPAMKWLNPNFGLKFPKTPTIPTD